MTYFSWCGQGKLLGGGDISQGWRVEEPAKAGGRQEFQAS